MDWRAHIEEPEDDQLPARVRGLRMTVDAVLGLLAEGCSIERVLADYPGLSESAVRACIEYSLQVLVNRRSAAIVRARLSETQAHPERVVTLDEVEREMKEAERTWGLPEEDDGTDNS